MSTLVILMPARRRHHGAGEAAPPVSAVATEELDYVLSNDGMTMQEQGRAPAPLLPRAEAVVLVLEDADVSWHRVVLPKAPASKLRAALAGLLEEQLLEDEAQLHFALSPNAMGGQNTWIAVMNKPWLAGELAKLASAGLNVDAIVPTSWPGGPAHGHFHEAQHDAEGRAFVRLCVSDDAGLHLAHLTGGLARTWLARWQDTPMRWTATPGTSQIAQEWLGTSLSILGEPERALQAAGSAWNLRQFDLAYSRRGPKAVRDWARQFMRPGWRPFRTGLVALLVLQLLGLNAWAWQQRQAVQAKRAALNSLLRETFPQVRTVLDAPAQMQRETDALRAAAGRAGEQDLESLLAAAAAAWPEGMAPAASVRFEGGTLTLGANGWADAQFTGFQQRTQLAGLNAQRSEGRITLARGAPKTATRP
jgi:general secretion pathway protein L